MMELELKVGEFIYRVKAKHSEQTIKVLEKLREEVVQIFFDEGLRFEVGVLTAENKYWVAEIEVVGIAE